MSEARGILAQKEMKVFKIYQKHWNDSSSVDERNVLLVQEDTAEAALAFVRKEYESHGDGYEYDEVEEVNLQEKVLHVYHWEDK